MNIAQRYAAQTHLLTCIFCGWPGKEQRPLLPNKNVQPIYWNVKHVTIQDLAQHFADHHGAVL